MSSSASLKMNCRSVLLLISAVSALPMLGGCASGREPITRSLPPAPAFAKPVAVREPKAGEPTLAVASRERSARKQNAEIITRFRSWYGSVRQNYGAK